MDIHLKRLHSKKKGGKKNRRTHHARLYIIQRKRPVRLSLTAYTVRQHCPTVRTQFHLLGCLLRVFSLLGVGVVATFGARGNVHELVEVVADFVATRPPLLPLVEDGGSRVVAARLVSVARLGESVPASFVAAGLFGVGVDGVSRGCGPLRLGLGSDVRGLRLRGPGVV